VALLYRALHYAENGPEAQLLKLKQEIARLEPFYREHKDKDYWWWRATIYDRIRASPDFDPDDVSVRHMHWAALNYLGGIRRYEELVEQLRKMEEEER
jgi:hypothetical protein